MSTVRCALIQTTGITPREAMVAQQVRLIREAAEGGAQIVCLQELATGPYFCQDERDEWFDLAEPIPDGPTTTEMMTLAGELGIVLVVPLFEEDDNFFYNTAAVIDADGSYLGKYRKTHIPYAKTYREKYYFKPGNTGFPVFDTAFGKIGVYICYDRHFPRGGPGPGQERGPDRVHPLGHRGSLQAVLAPGAAGSRRGQRLLRRHQQPGGH